jgi:hypothetical protein
MKISKSTPFDTTTEKGRDQAMQSLNEILG